MYKITEHTLKRAAELGVTVQLSKFQRKKIDVYKDGKRVASVGAVGYKDYPTYLASDGKNVADERRRLYWIRHKRDVDVEGSAGYYASRLLW
jgi:hypothetical protein